MVYGERLCVKLAEGTGAELVGGVLQSRTGVDLKAVSALFARGIAEPLVTCLSWDALDAWHRRALEVLPEGNRPGHLGLWFRLTLPDAAAADRLTAELFDSPLVAHVHKEPRPAGACMPGVPLPTDLFPPTPSYTALQGSHDPSPSGYGIWRAQGIYGARGQGIAVRMIENDWHLDHEDVEQCVAANFLGVVTPNNTGERNHGIAGASILCADRNAYGITGVADEVDIRFVSQFANGGVVNAMMLAGANSQPGDLHLMVLIFLFGQLGLDDWVPMEILQSVFDATLTITANGIHFVTSGANGGRSLDDPRFVRRFDRSFRDSGAIFVEATAGSAMQRATFANFGSRVDANGWGDGVVTCGVGSLYQPNGDWRQSYCANYAGTSAAVPGLAGVVAALLGAARAQLGRNLTRAEVFQLLANHGPQSPDSIGRRPDLVAMLQALGVIDGLEVSAPDVALGGTVSVIMNGPAGSAAFLFLAFGPGSTPLGLNRPVLLDLASTQTIGFFAMPAGVASWPLTLPNNPILHGVDLYCQAGRLVGAGPIHVTNSCQVTVL